MQLELLNEQGQAASKYDAPETVFGREYNEDLVHQVVVVFPWVPVTRTVLGPAGVGGSVIAGAVGPAARDTVTESTLSTPPRMVVTPL